MKMQNPGKIIIFLFVFTLSLHAGVKASVDSSEVVLGERVTFSLEITGEIANRPQLAKICGVPVVSTASSTNIRAINGSFTKSRTLSYTFMPKKDCTIEPIELEVDGKKEMTAAIPLTVIPQPVDKDPDFILELVSEKKSVYVGEPFKVTLIFKKRHNHNAVDFKFTPPQTKNFWIKEESQGRSYDESGFNISKQTYIMAAQKAGLQQISAAEMNIATRKYRRDGWGQWMPSFKWRSYFSNTVQIGVSNAPSGITLVGDFNITAEADRTTIDANEAVNLNIKVGGSGNFEDIGSLKPSIPGVSVFDEEGVTKAYIEKGKYKGVWRQKMAFVGSRDFTIPPIVLSYFDPKTKTIKRLKTEAIAVHVRNSVAQGMQQKVVVERAEEDVLQESDISVSFDNWSTPILIGLLGGLITGVLLTLLPWGRWLNTKGDKHAVNIKDHKAVLMLLLQHLDDKEAAYMVEVFEGNLFEGKNTPVDKRTLKTLIRRLQK